MSTLEEIEAAILKLPSDEFQQLMQWFFDLDYQCWDRQLEKDIAGSVSPSWEKNYARGTG